MTFCRKSSVEIKLDFSFLHLSIQTIRYSETLKFNSETLKRLLRVISFVPANLVREYHVNKTIIYLFIYSVLTFSN